MRRWPVLLALAGCGSEQEIVQDIPSWPDSRAPDVPSSTWTDRIVQVTVPQVDVLWTIDNSSSMEDEQAALAENFPSFASYFVGSGLDYHIGVVTTDIANPSKDGILHEVDGHKFIDPDTADPIELFEEMATVGIDGWGEESGLGGVFHALEENVDTANAGFYREAADLHTVIISDEEDQTPPSVVTPGEFVDWYAGLKTADAEYTFSSIVSFVDNPPADRGERYLGVTDSVGGIAWDIADTDWTFVLEQLGLQAGGYKTEFFLSHRPVPSTITVLEERADGVTIPHERAVYDDAGTLVEGSWTWDASRNSITFEEWVPAPLAAIVISYTLLAAE